MDIPLRARQSEKSAHKLLSMDWWAPACENEISKRCKVLLQEKIWTIMRKQCIFG